MKLYVGISKACDDCGGKMNVIVSRRPLREKDKQAIMHDTGNCSIDKFFECETDEPVSIEFVR